MPFSSIFSCIVFLFYFSVCFSVSPLFIFFLCLLSTFYENTNPCLYFLLPVFLFFLALYLYFSLSSLFYSLIINSFSCTSLCPVISLLLYSLSIFLLPLLLKFFTFSSVISCDLFFFSILLSGLFIFFAFRHVVNPSTFLACLTIVYVQV